MKKLLIASAVSAVFATPAVALAQAAVPTLDKVLEASGISVSGYIDAAYSHANRNLETSGFSNRVFDSQNNSFSLHQFGLTVAKQPKEGFGGLVNFTAGKDAQVIHSAPESTGSTSSMFDITQAYGQYAAGPITVIAGKFTTLHGTEVIASTGNNHFSRSILFGAVPFTHTGLRATYAVSDTVSLMAGVNNGWDQLQDSNKSKTTEIGATLTPIKPMSLSLSAMSGSEVVGATNGTRNSINAVGTYTLTDAISFGLEYLSVSQEHGTATGGTAKYSGAAGYFTYMISPKLRLAVRGESFDDADGFRFNTASGTKYREGTLTVSFLPTSNYEVRAEVRSDKADNAVFTDSTGASKSLMTFALQSLYKF